MKPQELNNLTTKLSEALPAQSGYEKGFKDAVESIALALAPLIPPGVLESVVQVALDAYANNADQEDSVTVNLSIRDDDSENIVDSTTHTMSVEQNSAIVDAASEVILARRNDTPARMKIMLNTLDEALSSAGVVNAPVDFYPGQRSHA